ncbi:unnamed protein product [Prunus armeniaca]|uniref:F-box associated beta-propeller type 3 domain-containing protein n=1 Tax=Prunus armeniaca TaxID=36596 RepID=A0A6J5W4J5_PRUAR|nr:unnamed protein product [Prunus armeniaca]
MDEFFSSKINKGLFQHTAPKFSNFRMIILLMFRVSMAWFVHPLTLTLFSYLTYHPRVHPTSPFPCNRNPQAFGYRSLWFNTFTLGRDYWWRPLQVDPRHLPFDSLAYAFDSYNNILRHSGSVCLNGVVHWIYEKQKLIVAFDFREETFKAIPLPEDYDQEIADYFDQDANHYIGEGNPDDYCHPSMVKVGGCVGVIVDMSWKRDEIMLWTLKDYHHNHVWVKETISLASEPRYLDCPRYVDALVTVHTGEFALVHYFVGLTPGYGDGPPRS